MQHSMNYYITSYQKWVFNVVFSPNSMDYATFQQWKGVSNLDLPTHNNGVSKWNLPHLEGCLFLTSAVRRIV